MRQTASGPYNLEAEMEVLGSIFLDPAILDEVIPILSPEDFSSSFHRRVYEAMVDLHRKGEAITPISVRDALLGMKVRADLRRLQDFMINTFTPKNAVEHARTVRKFAVLRRIIDLSTDVASRARKLESDPEDLLDFLEAGVFRILFEERGGEFVNLKDLALKVLNDALNGKDGFGIPTGISDLDMLIHGYTRGSLIVVGARPGVGKTAFMTDLALRLMDRGFTPALFSLEMEAEQIVARMIASLSRVELRKILSAKVPPERSPEVTRAVDRISRVSMVLDDTRFMDVMTLRSKIRQARRRGAHVVFVDYLQLILPHEKGIRRMRYEEIAEITRSLKILAGELHTSIVLLSQLSRDVEKREDHRPRLADLRESGAIEQDADVVIFLHDPLLKSSERPEKTALEVIVAKNRNGPTGSFQLLFDRTTMRFEEGGDDLPY